MPINFKTDDSWGKKFYLKTDPKQQEYLLIEIHMSPGKPKYVLRRDGYDKINVYECEISDKRDEVKYLENKDKDDE